MKKLDYYVIDVLSIVNGLPFDYINTYETLEEAKNEAERILKKDGIIRILLVKWNRYFNEEYEMIKEEVDESFDLISYNG